MYFCNFFCHRRLKSVECRSNPRVSKSRSFFKTFKRCLKTKKKKKKRLKFKLLSLSNERSLFAGQQTDTREKRQTDKRTNGLTNGGQAVSSDFILFFKIKEKRESSWRALNKINSEIFIFGRKMNRLEFRLTSVQLQNRGWTRLI